MIDLRSDTVTRPSPAMRRAIAEAVVGDDVWGEDPTVRALEERVAALLGREAAVYVPSGTMANQISLLCHTRPGEEVLIGWGSHVSSFESGAGAAWAGVQFKVLGGNGLFAARDVVAAIDSVFPQRRLRREDPNPADLHFAPTRLVWIENTHNRGGGRIFPQREVEAIAAAARERGLRVHLDGARLLNAAVASGRAPRELAAPADSASICLSKGLGAPVGSVLAGSAELIARARRYRKMLGGAMRQVGILAAAGLYALDHNIERLAEDHRNARAFAEGVAGARGLELELATVETNIVIFELAPPAPDADALCAACASRGLLLSRVEPRRVRAVTHLDVDGEACRTAARIVRDLLA
jgi:threonine aldolase